MNNFDVIEEKFKEAVLGMDSVWFESGDSKWFKYVSDLKEELKASYLLVLFNDQVNNGGFHQYFSNGYGQFSKETIELLNKIGASNKAQLLNLAYHEVNSENYSEEEFRSKLLNHEIEKLFSTDDLFDPLEKLDDEFYECDEDIYELLVNYLIGN